MRPEPAVMAPSFVVMPSRIRPHASNRRVLNVFGTTTRETVLTSRHMTMRGGGRIDGTREEILAILRRHDRMGVEDLARELGLAGATVRRHLDVLQRDNYVAVTQVRGRTGRPRHLFALTEAGSELFPHHYVRLTQRLLGE